LKKKMTAELQVQLMNELLSDNDALTKAVGMATREKAELCRTVSRLEKTLKHHTQKGCVLNVRICASSPPSTAHPPSLYHDGLSELPILSVRELGCFFLEMGLYATFPGRPWGS
jgi:hypothetical protein